MPRPNTYRSLRIIHFLLGMMFFFGIEQVFLNHIIHSASARGYVTIVYIIGVLAFDSPAGVIADRFSRKWCVVAACLVQAFSVLVLAVSPNLATYLIGSLGFGLAIALCDGAIQALLYDKLADESRHERYGREQGRNYAAFLIGAGVANVVSGFLAYGFGVRSAYFVSIIPCGLALWLSLSLVESTRHQQIQTKNWFMRLGTVARDMSRHRRILAFATQFVAAEILINSVGEFGQIYILSFGVSTVLLGLLWAGTALFAAGGRIVAEHLQSHPKLFIAVYCLILATFALNRHRLGIGLFWLFYGLNEALQNIAETEIQDETASPVRATTMSMIGFAGNLLAIPIIFVYNHFYTAYGIIAANRLILLPAIGVLLLTLIAKTVTPRNQPHGTAGEMPLRKV